MGKTPRVHDLILLRSRATIPSHREQPSWPESTLGWDPWVVVRRGSPRQELVPVGIRGIHRHERWAGYIDADQALIRRGPEQLRSPLILGSRRALPAFRALLCLENRLHSVALKWGPVGSVGFELASEEPAVTDRSDLDLVFFMPERFGRTEALRLWNAISALPCKADALVETPYCGFSLEEYAVGRSGKLLLRTPSGRTLGHDPWVVPDLRYV